MQMCIAYYWIMSVLTAQLKLCLKFIMYVYSRKMCLTLATSMRLKVKVQIRKVVPEQELVNLQE